MAADSADPALSNDLPLFVFGSLRDMDLLETVLGRPPRHVATEPAELGGFRCRRARGEVFPILVPEPCAVEIEATVPGTLLHGLSGDDLDRILFYEGGGYAPRPLAVTRREARRRTSARVFLATGMLQDSGETWDFDAWAEQDKPLALMLAEELMALYGVTPASAVDGPLWEDIKTRCHAALTEGGTARHRPAALS